MSCECEHKRMGRELDRFRRLAKVLARTSGGMAVIYLNEDGTYGFCSASDDIDKPIVEYITQY